MIKYCPKCHREAYNLVREGENIKVFQGGSNLLTIGNKSSVTMSVNCPNGHPVKLEIKPEEGTC